MVPGALPPWRLGLSQETSVLPRDGVSQALVSHWQNARMTQLRYSDAELCLTPSERSHPSTGTAFRETPNSVTSGQETL